MKIKAQWKEGVEIFALSMLSRAFYGDCQSSNDLTQHFKYHEGCLALFTWYRGLQTAALAESAKEKESIPHYPAQNRVRVQVRVLKCWNRDRTDDAGLPRDWTRCPQFFGASSVVYEPITWGAFTPIQDNYLSLLDVVVARFVVFFDSDVGLMLNLLFFVFCTELPFPPPWITIEHALCRYCIKRNPSLPISSIHNHPGGGSSCHPAVLGSPVLIFQYSYSRNATQLNLKPFGYHPPCFYSIFSSNREFFFLLRANKPNSILPWLV